MTYKTCYFAFEFRSLDSTSQRDSPSRSDPDESSDDASTQENRHSTTIDVRSHDTTLQEEPPSPPDFEDNIDDTASQTHVYCVALTDFDTKVDVNNSQRYSPSYPDFDVRGDVTNLLRESPSFHELDDSRYGATKQEAGPPALGSKSVIQYEYRMTRNPRGYAVIFNIETFYKVSDDPTSLTLENRSGSSTDAEGLKDAFEKLHFIVDRYDDKTIDEIITKMDEYASRDHSLFDCFVFCILTHGSEGKLYDANGRSFQFDLIFKKMHACNCPTLSGKPKLFFLQACQGNQSNFESDLQVDIVSMQPRANSNLLEGNTNFLEGNSPNEADFLVFFPARLGLPAFRNDFQGSWFIQSRVEKLKSYGESRPLLDILTMVLHEVSNMFVDDKYGNLYNQTPKFDSSLCKTVFFRPVGPP